MAGIVVGYDGTDSAKAALDAAIGLAKDLGEHVFGYQPYLVGGEAQDHSRTLKELGERVTAEAVETARNAGVDAEVVLVDREGAEALMTTAEERDARMIVVGNHGEGPVKGAILGSTPYRFVHTSETPVLVIPV